MRHLRHAAAALFALAALSGCSEKQAGFLVWKQDLISLKTALTGVATLPSRELLAVGHSIPEFSVIAHPTALLYGPAGWTQIPMPSPPTGSTALYGVAIDPSGAAWAVGRTVASEAEPFDPSPLAYRFDGSGWTQQTLASLGSLQGLTLTGVATGGSASAPEVRAVGDVNGSSGTVLRWIGGVWEVMALPSRPSTWTLRSIAHAIDGAWYAVGAQTGQLGGTILVDRGDGWAVMEPPPIEVDWTAVACDGRGVPYIAGNVPENGEQHGILCRLRHGAWVDVPITRKTSGEGHFFGLGFDAEGNGWAVGGRAGGGPYLVGYAPSGWTETLLEAQAETHPENEQVSGGDLLGVVVADELNAVSVGTATESGPEGESEFQPRVFRLGFRRAGEIDASRHLSP
jgi:hypothetical protein